MVPVPILRESQVASPAESTFYGRRIHLVGIGGCGMSNVAVVLLRQGAVVRGSDRQASEATLRLQALGVEVHLGAHGAECLGGDTDLVVVWKPFFIAYRP